MSQQTLRYQYPKRHICNNKIIVFSKEAKRLDIQGDISLPVKI